MSGPAFCAVPAGSPGERPCRLSGEPARGGRIPCPPRRPARTAAPAGKTVEPKRAACQFEKRRRLSCGSAAGGRARCAALAAVGCLWLSGGFRRRTGFVRGPCQVVGDRRRSCRRTIAGVNAARSGGRQLFGRGRTVVRGGMPLEGQACPGGDPGQACKGKGARYFTIRSFLTDLTPLTLRVISPALSTACLVLTKPLN